MPSRTTYRNPLLDMQDAGQLATMRLGATLLTLEREAHPRPEIPVTEGPLAAPDSLMGHIKHFYPGYQAGKLHEKIAAEIEAILTQPTMAESGQSRKWLMLFVPPQHGKTEVTSIQAPSWYLGTHPDANWVNSSYAAALAERNSRYARDIVSSADYASMYSQHLSMTSNSVAEWTLAGHRGGMRAIGVGGGLTGSRADVLVVDDPVKDRQDANSETVRKTTIDWWRSVARTRLHPDSVVILIMTRWHFGDLAGQLLADDLVRVRSGQEARWRVVRIPARADSPDDPLGRAEGEVAWPERFPTKQLAETFYTDLQIDMGPIEWASLGQQTPSLGADAIFKPHYWNYYNPKTDLPPVHMSNRGFKYIVQFWDTAFKEKQRSDYSSCSTLGVTGRGWYLLEVTNERLEMPSLLKAARAQADKWTPTHLYVENKASGPSMAQMLKVATRRLTVRLWEPPDGGDKVARAQAIVPKLAGMDGEPGLLWLPNDGPDWLADFLTQLYEFPAGTHDDMVDSFVGACQIAKDLEDGLRAAHVSNMGYDGGTSGGYIDERYVDRDTGAAPNPDLVRRR